MKKKNAGRKGLVCLAVLLMLAFTLAGCGGSGDAAGADGGSAADVSAEPVEVLVFAAASMQSSLEELEAAYEAAHPDVDIILNCDSSGTLKTQILEGAPCDIFFSAAQAQMNEVEEAGMVIEGTTLAIAVKQFNIARGDVPPLRFIHDTKDPSLYTVVLEDTAAEMGLLAALVANIIYVVTGNMYADGAASIFIGVLLCVVAVILLGETKGLLVGEGMKHQSLDESRDIVEADPRVVSCGRILTMYMGPDSLLITIDATFRGDISARAVLRAVDDIESKLKERWPQTARVFIEAESLRNVNAQQLAEEHWEDEDEGETGEQLDA